MKVRKVIDIDQESHVHRRTIAQPLMGLPSALADVADEAVGRRHRVDPIVGAGGGPAGNARLTAWTGILLLTLILGELVTLLDVNGLISWHVVLGSLLVPLALLKTATTTWRVGRYYTGDRAYRTAGPPPTLLRFLGPLVVVTTLGLLGTGLTLIALGPQAGRRPLITVFGFAIDPLTLHQIFFFAFATAAGLHLLVRIVPAIRLVVGRVETAVAVPGRRRRGTAILFTLCVAAVTAALVLGAVGDWSHDRGGSPHHHRHALVPPRDMPASSSPMSMTWSLRGPGGSRTRPTGVAA